MVVKQCHQCRTQEEAGRPPFKVCSGCKIVYYCSANCQNKHWKVHKLFCKPHANEDLRRMGESLANTRLGIVARDFNAPPIQDENTIILTSIPESFYEGPAAPGGHTECVFTAGLKEAILGQLGFPRPMPSPKALAHRLAAVPGAGIGMYATRPLVAGDIIYAERALLVTSRIIFPMTEMPAGAPQTQEARTQHALDDSEQLKQAALARMPPTKQAAYRALANSHLHDGSGPLLGIRRTNAWAIEPYAWRRIMPTRPEGEEPQYAGVCEVLSRINHSCSPNAVVAFHMPSFSFVLSAVRDIPTGAEITSPYTAVCAPAATRQQRLQPYGFTCTCAACAAPALSDARRREIETARAEGDTGIRAWIADAALPDDALSRRSLRVLQLVEEEGVQIAPAYEEHLAQLAAVHAALGERDEYLSVRKKALQLDAAKCGHMGVAGAGLPEMPEAHLFWRKRARVRQR